MNRVRSDEGLAYSAGSSFSAGVYYEGLFRAAFQSKSATAAQATQIVLDEIERIRKEKVSAEELETVKNKAIEIFPAILPPQRPLPEPSPTTNSPDGIPDYWETYRDKIKAVTVDDVLRVAQQYLHPDKLVILAVGNVDEMLKGKSGKAGDFVPEDGRREDHPDSACRIQQP